jgi:hypothetical protein
MKKRIRPFGTTTPNGQLRELTIDRAIESVVAPPRLKSERDGDTGAHGENSVFHSPQAAP